MVVPEVALLVKQGMEAGVRKVVAEQLIVVVRSNSKAALRVRQTDFNLLAVEAAGGTEVVAVLRGSRTVEVEVEARVTAEETV